MNIHCEDFKIYWTGRNPAKNFNRPRTLGYRTNSLEQLPVVLANKNQESIISGLTDKILKLNKELQKVPENSNKWNSIKSEIEKTDRKIDEEVYKLYGLTEEEIGAVEESV